MFLEIDNVLTVEELDRLRTIAAEAKFVDGRMSNPHNTAKNNMQAEHATPEFEESYKLVAAAFWRSEEFRNFCFPQVFAPPMLSRYDEKMSYGVHSDSAFLPVGQQPLRSDISCTVFINDPASYKGGELTIHQGSRETLVKGKAGSAVFYPSTTLHQVKPVTSGQRLVVISFIQSQISDERLRYLLYELNEIAALEGYNISPENRTRLEFVRQSLHRIWAS